MRNPITEFSGAEFLVFYAIVIGITVAICWLRRQSNNTTASLPLLPVPEHPDPYEIAYLRNGENELACVAIVRLMEEQFLRVTTEKLAFWRTKKWIEQNPGHPDAGKLDALEKSIFEMFLNSRTMDEAFKKDLEGRLGAYAVPYERELISERLLTSEDEKSEGTTTAFVAAAVIAVIGASRWYVGFMRERPVGFLIFMGLIGLSIAMSVATPDRLTERGKAYLKNIQDKWTSLRSSESGNQVTFAFLTGVFGMTALAATPFAFLTDMFKEVQSSVSAGGDGGCGGCGGCG